MTKIKELENALKSTEVLETESNTSAGTLGAIFCDDVSDAKLISEAARRYAKLVPMLEEQKYETLHGLTDYDERYASGWDDCIDHIVSKIGDIVDE